MTRVGRVIWSFQSEGGVSESRHFRIKQKCSRDEFFLLKSLPGSSWHLWVKDHQNLMVEFVGRLESF